MTGKKKYYVILSYQDELMWSPNLDKFEIGEHRYKELKHQFNNFKSYKKTD